MKWVNKRTGSFSQSFLNVLYPTNRSGSLHPGALSHCPADLPFAWVLRYQNQNYMITVITPVESTRSKSAVTQGNNNNVTCRGNDTSRPAIPRGSPVINGLTITSLHAECKASMRRLFSACAQGRLRNSDSTGISSFATVSRRSPHQLRSVDRT